MALQPQMKTAKPFSAEERLKRAPLKGLSSLFSDDKAPTKPKSEPMEDEESEQDPITAAEASLSEAKSAIESGDTEAAIAAIETAEEHLAQYKSNDAEEEQSI